MPSEPPPVRERTFPLAPAARARQRPPSAEQATAGTGTASAPATSQPRAEAADALIPTPAPVGRVFIVEDHPVVREGYALLFRLAPDIDIVGMAASAEEALEVLSELRPDLILIDMALPGMSGLDLIEQLHGRDATTRMLVVSGQARQVYEERALSLGALGFVSKDDGPGALLTSVRSALAGAPPA